MDNEDRILILILAYLYLYNRGFQSRRLKRKRDNTSVMSGHEFTLKLLSENDEQCFDLLRMSRDAFVRLSARFRVKGWLRDSKHISVEQKVAIFLFSIGENGRYAAAKIRFQHSSETIKEVFSEVLKAMMKFAREVVVPPSFDHNPDIPGTNMRLRQVFKGAVGALDGISIHAIVPGPEDKQYVYKRRGKGECCQNVLAVCDFNMTFTFILAGWEGLAHDSEVLSEAAANRTIGFPSPPPDKYYLCDGAYMHTRGYMTPYRNVGNGNGDFCRTRAANKMEKFNHAHGKLRNVITRAFGVLKARFPILKNMIPVSYIAQRNITIACFAIHNFIWKEKVNDEWFAACDQNEMLVYDEDERDDEEENEAEIVGPWGSASDRKFMANLREEIAQQLMQDKE